LKDLGDILLEDGVKSIFLIQIFAVFSCSPGEKYILKLLSTWKVYMQIHRMFRGWQEEIPKLHVPNWPKFCVIAQVYYFAPFTSTLLTFQVYEMSYSVANKIMLTNSPFLSLPDSLW